MFDIPLFLGLLSVLINIADAIQCYQCDSNEDDTCPANKYFDKRLNAMVDCGSFLAHNPGTFCMKTYQESSGWNRWIKVTRMCGARTEHGLAHSCRYWFEAQGVYKEVCYCQDYDGCNTGLAYYKGFDLLYICMIILNIIRLID